MTAHPPHPIGDPLADAVVAELDRIGAPARQALDAGLRHGLASLESRAPEAVAALLEQVETVPSRVDPLMLHRGDLVSLSVPPLWFGLCSITSALAYVHASPTAARPPAGAGWTASVASRGLAETGVWARQTVRPGGLLRGGPGYVATVRVRLLHAHARLTDVSAPGPWSGPADPARVWLGFTHVSFRALAGVGIEISGQEERRLYQYWSYVAHLLGLDENLYGDVRDHASAGRLRSRLDSTTPPPDDDARTLTAALVDAQARAMAGAPGAVLSEAQLRALIHGVLGRAFGAEPAEPADRPGLPAPAVTGLDLMPLIVRLNREARHWQNFSPASAQAARRRALEGPAPEVIAAVLPGDLAHRRNAAAADRPGAAPAA